MCSHIFIRIQTQMCAWTYIYRYIHISVYVHMSKYIRWECCRFERLPDRMVVCAEFLILRPWRITSTHTRIHIPQIHTCSNLGLVERNEYMWHFDYPKESDEVLFLPINTPNPCSCLDKASECITVESTGYSNIYYKNWTKGAEVRRPGSAWPKHKARRFRASYSAL